MPTRDVSNIVLVHSGFVDGSGWEGVYTILKRDGYTVSVVQHSTRSLKDDVAVTSLSTPPLPAPSWYLVTTEDKMIPPGNVAAAA